MPTGPLNAAADNTLAQERLGWQPGVTFAEGLRRTIAWYTSTHEVNDVRGRLAQALTER